MAEQPEVLTPWFNNSSNDGSSCFDVQHLTGGITQVRHSQNPEAVLTFTTAEWDAAKEGFVQGKFDHPASA
ncbi:DUF397 domain-containing protein [Streptomyces sp. NPDC059761]|uniref:DUF397 domain-containing protein n=1 Tax=Streptomyces sp. NPDC059761 TaxID=3346937 RepID=UPI003663C5CA